MKTATSRDGTKIVYETLGTGEPLVFITGAICHRLFKPVRSDAKAFSELAATTIYDRRGRGDSGDAPEYSLDRELDDLAAVIDAIGAPVNLYGHSSGAVLALEAGLKFPNKIKKICLYEIPYAPDEKQVLKNYAFCERLESLLQQRRYSNAIRSFLIDIGMPKIFTYLLPLMPGWKRLKALAPTLKYDMILTRDLPPYERVSKLQPPLKVLYGAKSTYDFKSISEKLVNAAPNAQIASLIDQDHMVDPRSLLPEFKSFFTRSCPNNLSRI